MINLNLMYTTPLASIVFDDPDRARHATKLQPFADAVVRVGGDVVRRSLPGSTFLWLESALDAFYRQQSAGTVARYLCDAMAEFEVAHPSWEGEDELSAFLNSIKRIA